MQSKEQLCRPEETLFVFNCLCHVSLLQEIKGLREELSTRFNSTETLELIREKEEQIRGLLEEGKNMSRADQGHLREVSQQTKGILEPFHSRTVVFSNIARTDQRYSRAFPQKIKDVLKHKKRLQKHKFSISTHCIGHSTNQILSNYNTFNI